MNPVEHLLSILKAAKLSAPPESAEWFADGVDGYFQWSGALDECLGLKPKRGQRSPRYQYQIHQRDSYIRAAYNLIEGQHTYKRAEKLATEVLRFESLVWPNVKDLDYLPDHYSDLRKNLFNAFKTGISVPGSARRLWEIATNPLF